MNLKGLKLHKTVKHATELIEKPLITQLNLKVC